MPTSAQTIATNKFIKNHTRRFVVQCHKKYDSDVIAYLESMENYTAEVKRLVREEIGRQADRLN